MRKIRKGVDIFILNTELQNTASSKSIFSLQPAQCKLVSWWMMHNLSGFYFLCYHFHCFWQEGGGKREKKNYLLCTLIFSFSKLGVLPCHSTQCSVQPEELYKNLIFLSSLEHIEPDSMEKIPFLDEFGYLIGAN